jgi:Mn2+/Fe2+ NRAMP family transporter
LHKGWNAFGPGLLFAGAAVGVSHIVQSTRGGATFGTAAILIVVVSCLVKWPAFRFGPLYAAATGESLLAGYRQQGRWVLAAFAILTAAILFTTLAAVTVVTAGLLINLFTLEPRLEALGINVKYQASVVSAALLLGTAVLIALGGYRWLDRLMKILMPVLALATIAATLIAITRLSTQTLTVVPAINSAQRVGLTAGVIGWMPAPIDIAVWSSLWALARARASKCTADPRAVLRDFDVGYITTLILAICFVVLGAAIMYGPGRQFSPSAAGFAGQVVDLYTENLGNWSWPIIATAAFLAMLSTTVTCADGFPRAVAALISEAWPKRGDGPEGSPRTYWVVFGLGVFGAVLILLMSLGRQGVNFTHLVDFVTITSFIAAPILAFFNHRAVHSEAIPLELRPSGLMTAWSWVGIVLMASFALSYIVFRLWSFNSS